MCFSIEGMKQRGRVHAKKYFITLLNNGAGIYAGARYLTES